MPALATTRVCSLFNSLELREIASASKTNILGASSRLRMVAHGRFYFLRRVVPSPASNHLPASALRSLRIPDVAAYEAFREPVRYPLCSIAGKILRAVRTATGIPTPHCGEPSFVRIVRRLTE